MAIPVIKLLQRKPLSLYMCDMCKARTTKSKFSWKSWFTGTELIICRDCAYKESFGTKKIKKAKKERILEQKEINE